MNLSIKKLWFLDFETNKAGDFYLAGLMNKFDFEQVVLHQGLEGLADYQGLKIEKPEIFISSLLETIADDGGILVAYSLAEQEAISRCIPPGQVTEGIHYLNLRKAAGSWVSKFRKSEMDALPPLIKTASDYDQKRQRKSLASICRLIDFPAPKDYAPGKTTSRFNSAISALEKRQQAYDRLTAVQKAKITKGLKHNKFDVLSMAALYLAINKDDPAILARSTHLMEFN